jgi:hypothetical protein
MNITRRFLLKLTPLLFWRGSTSAVSATEAALPFGDAYPQLDTLAVGEWWNAKVPSAKKAALPPAMDVPRDEIVAFALYTHDHGVLKLTAQFFPLKPGEARKARLEFQRDGVWSEVATEEILYPGWSAHFRTEKWDATQNVAYRVRHGDKAMFEGLIRRDPIDKNEIVIANMSCNSSRTGGLRPEIVEHLRAQDPDLLFFAGDQTYRHTEHTAGWVECLTLPANRLSAAGHGHPVDVADAPHGGRNPPSAAQGRVEQGKLNDKRIAYKLNGIESYELFCIEDAPHTMLSNVESRGNDAVFGLKLQLIVSGRWL